MPSGGDGVQFYQTLLYAGLVSDREEENDPCPLIKTDECTFAYIKQSNVYMVATMRANSNVAMLFSLMHRICQVMGEYFKEVEEESIRDNFVICYELLDELVDFGYPQTTDAKILQEYITQVRLCFTMLFLAIKLEYNPF